MEAHTEGQRLVAGVVNRQGQTGLGAFQRVAHFQQEVEGIDELGQTVGGQGENDLLIGGRSDLPGQKVGKSVNLHGIVGAAKMVHAAVGLAAIGEQNGNPAAGAVGGLIVFVAQPEILLPVPGEGGGHTALFGGDGEGVLAVGQGEGGILGGVLFIGAVAELGHGELLLSWAGQPGLLFVTIIAQITAQHHL